jgi:hypothetical protein
VYSSLPSFVLGFHGCDAVVCEKIVNGKDTLKPSSNDYDWLGNGIYFWENDPLRAMRYAELLQKYPKRAKAIIRKPAVIGAIIDVGRCLNLIETKSLDIVKTAYELFKSTQEKAGLPLPENKPVGDEQDLLLRKLDCAVIETIHAYNKENDHPEYDSVRGVFWEGNELYPNAGFKERNHIQICVRNVNCIKGYFTPLDADAGFPVP